MFAPPPSGIAIPPAGNNGYRFKNYSNRALSGSYLANGLNAPKGVLTGSRIQETAWPLAIPRITGSLRGSEVGIGLYAVLTDVEPLALLIPNWVKT